MSTHSSTLAWRIPGTGEPGGLPSMGSHRVGHDWSDLAVAVAAEIQKLPTASLVRGFPASPGWVSIPNSFVSLFVFYNLSYLLSKRMGCLSGCLVSSASIQKLFCGSCSAFKWSFDEFWGEKWSPHPIPLSFRTVPPRIILVRRERLKWNIFILVLNFYFSIGFNCIYLPLEKASFLLYCICSKNISSISHDCSLYIFYV